MNKKTIGIFAYTNDNEAFETGVTTFNYVLFDSLQKINNNYLFKLYLSIENSKRYNNLNNNIEKILLNKNYFISRIMK